MSTEELVVYILRTKGVPGNGIDNTPYRYGTYQYEMVTECIGHYNEKKEFINAMQKVDGVTITEESNEYYNPEFDVIWNVKGIDVNFPVLVNGEYKIGKKIVLFEDRSTDIDLLDEYRLGELNQFDVGYSIYIVLEDGTSYLMDHNLMEPGYVYVDYDLVFDILVNKDKDVIYKWMMYQLKNTFC